MDLKRIRSFVAVVEQGSASNAALHLHISQPALSRQIHDLQKELGFQLFDHVGRGLALTSQGEQVLDHCRKLLSQAGLLGEHAELIKRGDSGVLRVAASPVQIETVISTFLHRYANRYPDVEVKLTEAVGSDIVTMLEHGEVHVGILLQAVRTDDRRFGRYPVPPIGLHAAYHPSFLEARRTIEIGVLVGYPLLLLDTGFFVRRKFDAVCRIAGVEPDIRFESRAASNLLALAEARHGVAVIPAVVATHRYDVRTAALTFQRKPLRELAAVVWDKRRVLPRYAEDFCRSLAAHMREFVPSTVGHRPRMSRGSGR